MRVNIYAEELTDLVEVIAKEIDGHTYHAVRFYLQLPCTITETRSATDMCGDPIGKPVSTQRNVRGPFMHRPGDDDSAAVTFWGRKQIRALFVKAIDALDVFEATQTNPPA